MLKKDLKKLIAESKHNEWLNGLELALDFEIGQVKVQLEGFYDIYFFIEDEFKKWEKGDELEGISVFEDTETWFEYYRSNLSKIVSYIADVNADESQPQYVWDNYISNADSPKWGIRSIRKNIYLRDFSETQFIIDLNEQNNTYANAAHAIFIGDFDSAELSDIDFFYGAIKTYEFRSKNTNNISSRAQVEEKNINELRIQLGTLLRDSEEKTALLQKELEDRNLAFSEKLTNLEESSEQNLKDLNDHSYQELNKVVENTNEHFKKHEEAYKELLKLKAPAEYWEKRAVELKEAGRKWLIGLIAATLAGVGIIGYLIFTIQEDSFNEHINNPAISIRWSILSIILLTLIAFLVRVFTKMMMSNFHLYRDAQERKQLTYLYLSLINESEVSDADRNIILQALFSRADTGLLKDDSGPTMPMNLVDKINKQ